MNLDAVVRAENDSIRSFLERCAYERQIRGRVLDYGCGRQPYRGIVEAEILKGNAESYRPYDRIDFPHSMAHTDVGGEPGNGGFETVICTQVIQYIPTPQLVDFLRHLRRKLTAAGWLLLTGPTNWPDINDYHRLTKRHVEWLLGEAGFPVAFSGYREPMFDEGMPFGYWAMAHA